MKNSRSRRNRKGKSGVSAASGLPSGGASTQNQKLPETLAGITVKLAEKVFQLEKSINQLEKAGRASEYRVRAATKLLARVGVTDEDVAQTIEDLQVADFETLSAEDDATKGLERSDDSEVLEDSTVVLSIKYLKDGSEIPGTRVLRSKVDVSRSDSLAADLKEKILGRKVGDEVEMAVSDGITARVSIHSVLRKKMSTEGAG